MSREHKVRTLEDLVLAPMERGTTQLGVRTLPKAEYRLYEHVQSLLCIPYKKLTESQKQVLRRFRVRLAERVLDLFSMWTDANFCYGNTMAKSQFTLRLYWFLQELAKDSAIWIKADEIEAAHLDDGDDVDHVDNYFKTTKPTYTEASWDEFEHEVDQVWIKHLRETGQLEGIIEKHRARVKEAEKQLEHDRGIKRGLAKDQGARA